MLKRFFAATVLVPVASIASAEISASVQWQGPHVLGGGAGQPAGTVVWVLDLQVTVTGDDAWVFAGGPTVGIPWITLRHGTFFQATVNDGNPPYPWLFQIPAFADSQWTSFFTTHLGYPNTPDQGVSASFMAGPIDNPRALIAEWFCAPDGNNYAGTFTIARFAIIPDPPPNEDMRFFMDMQIGGRETPPIRFTWCWPLTVPPPGDVNYDFFVDLRDLAALLGVYGTCSGEPDYDPRADVDSSGCIDRADLTILLFYYGTNVNGLLPAEYPGDPDGDDQETRGNQETRETSDSHQ